MTSTDSVRLFTIAVLTSVPSLRMRRLCLKILYKHAVWILQSIRDFLFPIHECNTQNYNLASRLSHTKEITDYATDWTVRGSNRGRGRRFVSSPNRPDRLWGPTRLHFNRYPEFFLGAKAAGAWCWPLSSIYSRGSECVELYLHSPYMPSWRGE
jgi:hypothetical protein